MSIESEITRINTNIAATYTAADGKGATMPLTQNSANLANTIGSIQQGSLPTLQEKSATPSVSAQIIEPDSGYDGLLKVNIAATPLETATIMPTTSQQTITPTSPNIGFSSVTVEAAEEIFFNNAGTPYTKNMVFPNSVTSVSFYGLFGYSIYLETVEFKALVTMSVALFNNCSALTFAKFANTLTQLKQQCFFRCSQLQILDLSDFINPATIPTLENINALNSTHNDLKILVANQEMLDAFTAATNWSTYADRFQIKGV